jgi:hypothetical protein
VEREFLAIRNATDHFLQATQQDPTILQGYLRYREIVVASSKLEGTYVLRLFAEFETGARQFWFANWNTYPKTFDLLEGLAARCGIPDAPRENAHLVRDYRNSLVHEREIEMDPISIAVARHHLCYFFSFLPPKW